MIVYILETIVIICAVMVGIGCFINPEGVSSWILPIWLGIAILQAITVMLCYACARLK